MNSQKTFFRIPVSLLLLIFSLSMVGCTSEDEGTAWQLVWSDEFEGAEGSAINESNWNFDIGDGTDSGLPGWGNNELQYYTDSTRNVALDGEGNLVITAYEESFEGANYTSARITTEGKQELTYGRVEARLKTPYSQGLWPAFWLLGVPVQGEVWPQIGEIDIMELRGQEPTKIAGSVHGPGYSAGNAVTDNYQLANSRFDTEFHVFAIEWFEDRIDYYVDDFRYNSITKAQIEEAGNEWVFNDPFYIILNVAVGGNYVGNPDGTTRFPQTMIVDYVRVYSE